MELSQRRTRLCKRLHQRKTRSKEALVLVEGVRGVHEALAARAVVSFAVTSPRLSSTEAGEAMLHELGPFETATVTDREMKVLAGTDHPQGVLLVCDEPVFGVRDLPAGGRVLLLDAIQDPGNVGTLVRSAVAFGLDAVVCLDGSVDPWSTKAVRASAGMAFRVPLIVCSAGPALAALRERGIPVLVASAEGRSVAPADGASGFGLVLGNEGIGVRDEVREAATATIGVAMSGPAESLNVGIAGSILLYDLTRGDA
ncbi:MAG: RNA methyltransferase [Gemmatimonadetes bacterium]|nr:RNA methyltransferase [Gemmatimonadota bacterium]